ncbi:type II secretion system protein GspC [Vibrio algivorus]|uniref:Type II secretion system protein GspC n=1 Tax=Vibrio algivorus TaxID=1667024 RepID=A0A557PC65_9VIBR|nr:type II secretion system protein GspC [Vibrio algivorus]TVO38255.1 type II secretion system protein GspC [Vibrio algivorus]GLT13108.1 type II secretion system protein GspC [Vibrio algivorus]
MVSKDNIQQQWTQLANRWIKNQAQLSFLMTLLLTALIAWVVGILLWGLLSPASHVARWSAPNVIASQTTSNSQTDTLSPLLSANLFGLYTQTPTQKQQVAQDAPQTRLNLTLVGAVASSNDKLSLAIIANQGKQATYGIGETIDGTRVTLSAVYVDRVIISNQGRDETLMLQGIDYNKSPQSVVRQPAENQVAKDDVADLDSIRQEISSDPQKIFQYIRLSQVMDEGQLKGYRVRPGSERALFDQVGLQDGDIATALNGQDLTDQSQMAALWKTALESMEWNLTVERDGQTHDIYIQF